MENIITKFIIPYSFFTFLFTLILYTPVIIYSNGIESILNNKFVQSQNIRDFINSLYPHFIETLKFLFRKDTSSSLNILMLLMATLTIVIATIKKNYKKSLLLPSFLIAIILLLIINRRTPYPRTYLYLLPILFIYVDISISFILNKYSKISPNIISLILIICALIFSIKLIASNSVAKYRDMGYVPNAENISKYIGNLTNKKTIIKADIPLNKPLYYYLDYHDIDFIISKNDNHNKNDEIIYAVEKNRYSLKDLIDKPNSKISKILEFKEIIIYKAE